jgi:hypothetical protein
VKSEKYHHCEEKHKQKFFYFECCKKEYQKFHILMTALLDSTGSERRFCGRIMCIASVERNKTQRKKKKEREREREKEEDAYLGQREGFVEG